MKERKHAEYRVLIPFRYPISGITQWHYVDALVTLPPHAAEMLLRQGKIEEV